MGAAGHLTEVDGGRCLHRCQGRPCGVVVVGWWCGREHVAVDWRLGLLSCPAANIWLHKIRGGKRDVFKWTIVTAEVEGGSLVPLYLRAGKASGCISIGRSYQPRFSEVIFGFEVFDFGTVGAVDDAHGNRKHGIALTMLDRGCSEQ